MQKLINQLERLRGLNPNQRQPQKGDWRQAQITPLSRNGDLPKAKAGTLPTIGSPLSRVSQERRPQYRRPGGPPGQVAGPAPRQAGGKGLAFKDV